jgi:hypothetical protein
MQPVQRVLFFLGCLTILLAILLEFSSLHLLPGLGAVAVLKDMPRPGIGISYVAVLDLLLLYTLALLGLDAVAPTRGVVARLQGIVTFILSLLGLLAVIALIFVALNLLALMVSLLLAVPFGTLIYLGLWGDFAIDQARVLLGSIMLLKLIGVALLLLSRPLFLKNKGFMLLMITSVGATFALGFLLAPLSERAALSAF